MAVLYRRYPDEIHVYKHRHPKRDGGNPWLVATVIVSLFLAFRLFVLAVMVYLTLTDESFTAFMKTLDHDISISFFGDGIINVLLLLYILSQFTKLVFSTRKREVYWSLFFFRKRIASFDELEPIRLVTKPLPSFFTYHYYAVRRRGQKLGTKPLAVSPHARKMNRLSLYYHEIVPLLNSLLSQETPPAIAPEEEEETQVEAMEVEVPTDEAQRILANQSACAYQYFTRTDDGYVLAKNSWCWWLFPTTVLFLAPLLCICFYAILGERKPEELPPLLICAAFLLIFLVLMIATEPLYVTLDPKGRRIILHTFLGLRKKARPLERLRGINPIAYPLVYDVNLLFGRLAIGPTLLLTTNSKKMHVVLKEFGEIMSIDVQAYIELQDKAAQVF